MTIKANEQNNAVITLEHAGDMQCVLSLKPGQSIKMEVETVKIRCYGDGAVEIFLDDRTPAA